MPEASIKNSNVVDNTYMYYIDYTGYIDYIEPFIY